MNLYTLKGSHPHHHHPYDHYDDDDDHHNRFKELQTINVWGLWGGAVELYKLSTAGPIMDWIVIRGPNLQRLYFNNANQSTAQGSIYFVGPELDICPFWNSFKQLKRLEDWNKSSSLKLFLLRTPTIFISSLVPHSIARSNIFLSRERDTEMKINDKISSQSIKQNERSALKGQIK